MTTADLQAWMEFSRAKTNQFIETLASQANVQEILGWRPGPGRAHLAWQLMHLGATDDRHLNQRMKGVECKEPEYVHRFAGGSTPDDDVPTLNEIRRYLTATRTAILEHLRGLDNSELDQKPNEEAKWPYREWFQVLAWHEAHHQGQAHLTYNLYKASRAG